MANIIRRGGEGREMQQPARGGAYWDPFRMLSGLMGWDPFGDLGSLVAPQTFVPAFDVRETKDAYIFEADLPGIDEKDLDISVTGNRLSISGRRESEQREESDQYYCSERSYGNFVRTFTLPDDAETERVNAEFKDGVLRVKIPKRAEAQPRRVSLTGAREGDGGQRQVTSGSGQKQGSQQQASAQQQAAAQQQPSASGQPSAGQQQPKTPKT